jgi:hypothetical protein
LKSICVSVAEGVDHIEAMLRKQLIAAIGKEVTPVDFNNYMHFHNMKLFKAQYQPKLFAYAIRRPDHYPEGLVTIESQQADGTLAQPIQTIVASSPARRPMYFSLDASTRVAFMGQRAIHGFIMHQFSGNIGQSLTLIARARQFSSFVILVGRIASAELFEPKLGLIVQNKDMVKLPLILETIPTPKEFRDAIESLSPEQQRFAKAFRSMQLESTLFGIAIIQIKPQLEKVLKLPDDSLTKEIALSEDLLNLFIEYQIPVDLLSYNGDENATVERKIETVRGYVRRMQELIKGCKEKQLREEEEKQAFRRAQEEAERIKLEISRDEECEMRYEKCEECKICDDAPMKSRKSSLKPSSGGAMSHGAMKKMAAPSLPCKPSLSRSSSPLLHHHHHNHLLLPNLQSLQPQLLFLLL